MGREKKEIQGQLTFDFCTDSRNYVVQANSLIGGRQALKLNSAKLIRAAIMQVVRDDEDLKPYIITINELSELLGVPSSNIYRDIEDITSDILNNPVEVREETPKGIRWIKIPWVQKCEYNSDIGVALKLNNELKPFLINLRNNYTQYSLQEILVMKSVYAIRIYELLNSKIMTRRIPKNGVDIEIPVDDIKSCCGCTGQSYNTFANFRVRVLDKAVTEINDKTFYKISYTYRKKGKSVTAILFHIILFYYDL